jgi:hypothetical protein
MTAAAPPLAPDLTDGLRRLKLAAMRQLAPDLLQPIRPASTFPGTPLAISKHSASVVPARSSAANRTNRNRHQASTAQDTCRPPSAPQPITRCSPGDHTAGRRPR